jgi:uncharacterized protein YuzE
VRITYDRDRDTLEVALHPETPVDHAITIDDQRRLDLDAEGRAVRITVTAASRGIRVLDLVEPYALEDFRAELTEIEGLLP